VPSSAVLSVRLSEGAIGATSGATAGAIDEKAKDEVVVTHEERPR